MFLFQAEAKAAVKDVVRLRKAETKAEKVALRQTLKADRIARRAEEVSTAILYHRYDYDDNDDEYKPVRP
jgi:hypothetical protein